MVVDSTTPSAQAVDSTASPRGDRWQQDAKAVPVLLRPVHQAPGLKPTMVADAKPLPTIRVRSSPHEPNIKAVTRTEGATAARLKHTNGASGLPVAIAPSWDSTGTSLGSTTAASNLPPSSSTIQHRRPVMTTTGGEFVACKPVDNVVSPTDDPMNPSTSTSISSSAQASGGYVTRARSVEFSPSPILEMEEEALPPHHRSRSSSSAGAFSEAENPSAPLNSLFWNQCSPEPVIPITLPVERIKATANIHTDTNRRADVPGLDRLHRKSVQVGMTGDKLIGTANRSPKESERPSHPDSSFKETRHRNHPLTLTSTGQYTPKYKFHEGNNSRGGASHHPSSLKENSHHDYAQNSHADMWRLSHLQNGAGAIDPEVLPISTGLPRTSSILSGTVSASYQNFHLPTGVCLSRGKANIYCPMQRGVSVAVAAPGMSPGGKSKPVVPVPRESDPPRRRPVSDGASHPQSPGLARGERGLLRGRQRPPVPPGDSQENSHSPSRRGEKTSHHQSNAITAVARGLSDHSTSLGKVVNLPTTVTLPFGTTNASTSVCDGKPPISPIASGNDKLRPRRFSNPLVTASEMIHQVSPDFTTRSKTGHFRRISMRIFSGNKDLRNDGTTPTEPYAAVGNHRQRSFSAQPRVSQLVNGERALSTVSPRPFRPVYCFEPSRGGLQLGASGAFANPPMYEQHDDADTTNCPDNARTTSSRARAGSAPWSQQGQPTVSTHGPQHEKHVVRDSEPRSAPNQRRGDSSRNNLPGESQITFEPSRSRTRTRSSNAPRKTESQQPGSGRYGLKQSNWSQGRIPRPFQLRAASVVDSTPVMADYEDSNRRRRYSRPDVFLKDKIQRIKQERESRHPSTVCQTLKRKSWESLDLYDQDAPKSLKIFVGTWNTECTPITQTRFLIQGTKPSSLSSADSSCSSDDHSTAATIPQPFVAMKSQITTTEGTPIYSTIRSVYLEKLRNQENDPTNRNNRGTSFIDSRHRTADINDGSHLRRGRGEHRRTDFDDAAGRCIKGELLSDSSNSTITSHYALRSRCSSGDDYSGAVLDDTMLPLRDITRRGGRSPGCLMASIPSTKIAGSPTDKCRRHSVTNLQPTFLTSGNTPREASKVLTAYSQRFTRRMTDYLGMGGTAEEIIPLEEVDENGYLSTWITPGYDLYAVCFQECISPHAGDVIANFCSKINRGTYLNIDFENRISGRGDGAHMNSKSTMVAVCVRAELLPESVQVHSSFCYSFNILNGSKGCVAVLMEILSEPILLIGCHLTPASAAARELSRQSIRDKLCRWLKVSRFSEAVNHVIWCGDFNFRLREIDAKRTVHALTNGKLLHLLNFDEIRDSIWSNDLALDGFSEMPINFYPTYKKRKYRARVDRVNDSDWVFHEYDIKHKTQWYKGGRIKSRTPAWTDRVLKWTRREGPRHLSYIDGTYTATDILSSANPILESDHSPVGVGMVLQPTTVLNHVGLTPKSIAGTKLT